MAFGKSCGNSLSSKRGGLVAEGRGLGSKRKRILISENLDVLPMNSVPSTPSENRCTERMVLDPQTFNLEACPQDILVSTKFSSFHFEVNVPLCELEGLNGV